MQDTAKGLRVGLYTRVLSIAIGLAIPDVCETFSATDAEADAPKPATTRRMAHQQGRGEALFDLNCAPCHGRSGAGDIAFNAPAISGQHDWYLDRQLKNFMSGARGSHPRDLQGMQMASMVRLLPDDQSVKDVVTHITGLSPFHTSATLDGDAVKGKPIFTGTCMPCHGESAEGRQVLNAPRLAGQHDWYLVRQLMKFKEGVRGAHKDDVTGMQMAAMAKTLIDEESIRDLAAYINSLK